MITLRRSDDRGRAELGWLDSRHTFSFSDYYDPAHMGFRSLRVINEDRVRGGAGFSTHPHRDMEIISYVLEGGLAHKDSMGNGSVIRPGDVQRMTAGRGVLHSEHNDSHTDAVHFLQIWIVPEQRNLDPGYEQRAFDLDARRGNMVLVASRDGRDGSLTIHQDVDLYAARLDAGAEVTVPVADGRGVWLQVTRGALRVQDAPVRAGDGVAIEREKAIRIAADERAEFLLFDLA